MAKTLLTPLSLVRLSAPPASPQPGWVYFDTGLEKGQLYTGSAWVDIPGSGGGAGPPLANPRDDFRLKLILAELITAQADATSFAFTFPEALAAAIDAVKFGFLFPELNAAPADNLTQLRINVGGGSEGYITMDGSGVVVTTPDSVPLSITSDIDVRICAALDDYTPATNNFIFAKSQPTGNQRSWIFGVTTTGQLHFQWSGDGIAFVGNAVNAFLPDVGVVNGQAIWMRGTFENLDGTNREVKCYYSLQSRYTAPDDVVWIQLGATLGGIGNVAIVNSTAPVTIGSQANDAGPSSGKFFYGEIRNGIAGTKVANPDFRGAATGDTSYTDTYNNVWTIDAGVAVGSPGDIIPAQSDNIALGLQYAESNLSPTDLVTMVAQLSAAETVPALADNLLRLGIIAAETSPALSDTLLRLGLIYAETIAAPTDVLAQLKLIAAESNTAPTDNLSQLGITLGSLIAGYASFNGTFDQHLMTPDTTANSLAGPQFEFVMDIEPTDWTPVAAMRLGSKQTTAQFGYTITLVTTGTVRFTWSTDGTLTSNIVTTIPLPFTNERKVLKVTVDLQATGGTQRQLKVYYADTWAGPFTLHETVTTSGAIGALHNSTAPLVLGQTSQASGAEPFIGKLYRWQLRSSISGTVVHDLDLTANNIGGSSTYTEDNSVVWTKAATANVAFVSAIVTPTDTIPAQSDAFSGILRPTYNDTNVAPTESLTTLRLNHAGDTNVAPTDGAVLKVTYTATGTFVAPTGVTTVTVRARGAGQGGLAGTALNGGTSGDGGDFVQGDVAVTAGNTYTVTVPVASAVGGNGGDCWFGTATTLRAKGGNSPNTNIGTTIFTGGTGAAGAAAGAGRGGGGGAGDAANGTAGAQPGGGAGGNAGGGNGGAGGAAGVATGNGVAGTAGNIRGGGGGGGGSAAIGTPGAGSTGGRGEMDIIWTDP